MKCIKVSEREFFKGNSPQLKYINKECVAFWVTNPCRITRKVEQNLPLTPPGVKSTANSGMTLHSLVLISDSFSCNCNSINSHLSIDS